MRKILLLFFIFSLVFISISVDGQSAKSVLIVIDMQEEYTIQSMDSTRSANLINSINEAIQIARPMEIVFVKADMQVLSISLKGITREEAKHSNLDGRLYRKKNDLIITKHESSAFTLVELRDYINGADIGDIYLCGIMLGKCVSNTALDGISRGYSMSVIKECVTANKESKSDKYLQELAKEGVRILTIDDFKKELEL